MNEQFFEKPILNSPYLRPSRHWELDEHGQPTHQVEEKRRPAEFITPIPKPRKRKKGKEGQKEMVHDEGKGLSDASQQYALTELINDLRFDVEQWRHLPNPSDWLVTPQTARLLQHWRDHEFSDIRPFFCQLEAVETAIWLTEVAPPQDPTSGDRMSGLVVSGSFRAEAGVGARRADVRTFSEMLAYSGCRRVGAIPGGM